MIILGISEGRTCSAAIMKDGRVIACASEERFTRVKNEVGYPKQSIDFCLRQAQISADDIDVVAFAGTMTDLWWSGIRNEACLSVADNVFEQYEYYKKILIEKKPNEEVWPEYIEKVKARKKVEHTGYYDFSGLSGNDIFDQEKLREVRKNTVMKHLGVTEEKIQFIDHHTCHAHFAYFSSPYREEPVLIFTLDSSGDRGVNATVRVADEKGITLLHESTNFQFGRIYKYITLLLGMKPQEHEYKVMGLAPYGNVKEIAKSYPVFEEIQKVNGYEFEWNKKPGDLYFHFRDALEGHRFDGIAGALQKRIEELVGEWVKNALQKTNIKTVVLGGGVAMNIKMNLAISKFTEVEKISIGPSPGDESNAMGVCYVVEYEERQKKGESYKTIPTLEGAYLGEEFDSKAFIELIEKEGKGNYTVSPIDDKGVAQLLSQGKIVARCIGRMEFGARALGNRSILAHPSNLNSVKQINRQIKHRDFWMPFACSVLEECGDEYLENPKKLNADYMTLGFETTSKAKAELLAALHPEDLSARPQIVRKEQSPHYHNLISEFRALTSIGGLLNTSLNLHGFPIVNTPEDLLFVLEGSDLEYVYVQGHLVSKKK